LSVRRRREKSETDGGYGAGNNGSHLSLLSKIRDPAAILRRILAVSKCSMG